MHYLHVYLYCYYYTPTCLFNIKAILRRLTEARLSLHELT